jgi:hypothetical protein
MKVRIALAGLVAVASIMVATPNLSPAAEAASRIDYCFRHTNGAPGTTGPNSYTVLAAWENGSWSKALASGKTYANGCGAFSLSGAYRNYYVKVFFYARVGSSQWVGETPLYGSPGSSAYHLGTGLIVKAT